MSAAPHNPCATCGRCCRSYVVPVCGHDIWQICRAQRLSPASFLVAAPQPKPDPEGFRLERDGPTFYVVLDKRGRFTIKQRCVFLVTLAGGHERCGIYEHRPMVCRTYPMNLMASVVSPRPDLLCPPDSWPDEVIRRPTWRANLIRQRMRFDVYSVVVARWNARVAAAPPDYVFPLPEYASYLLNVYDRLAALDEQLGAARLAEVEATWRRLALPADAPGQAADDDAPPAWLDYVARALRIVNGFYSTIAPITTLPWLIPAATAPTSESNA
jgi:Fe-S-cluster containining protein